MTEGEIKKDNPKKVVEPQKKEDDAKKTKKTAEGNKGQNNGQHAQQETGKEGNQGKKRKREDEGKKKSHGSKHPMREDRGKKQHESAHWNDDLICLCCRQRGHTLAHCPKNPDKGDGGNKGSKRPKLTCFNCGQDGHNLKKCPKPLVNGGLAFAVCFVCKEKGHISAKCPKNTHGIYPKGGSCKICGDVWHLAKDCPAKGTAKDKKAAVAGFADMVTPKRLSESAEDLAGNVEYDFKQKGAGGQVSESSSKPEEASAKKSKVVKFPR